MIYLVAPSFDSFISGGNIFNKQIFNALQAVGRVIRQVEYPFKSNFNIHHDDILIFDSIYIIDVDLDYLGNVKCQKYFICHLLPSMIAQGKGIEYEKRVLNIFDKVIVNSMFCNDIISRWNLSCELVVIQPYIDIPAKMVFDENYNDALIIANWVPSKQIDKLLLCLAKVKQLPISISIIGSSKMDLAYFNYGMDIISQSDLLSKKVKILGAKDKNETWLALLRSKVLLDCSTFETYGMAVAEALSIGLPVLTLGKGNIKYLVSPDAICDSIDVMVERIVNENWSTRNAKPNDKLITNWDKFLHQFAGLV